MTSFQLERPFHVHVFNLPWISNRNMGQIFFYCIWENKIRKKKSLRIAAKGFFYH